jgi:hypothetical protein
VIPLLVQPLSAGLHVPFTSSKSASSEQSPCPSLKVLKKGSLKASSTVDSLLKNPELQPVREVDTPNFHFFIGPIVESDNHYDQVIMYACDKSSGKILPRSLYRSNSSGVWRSTPGYDEEHQIYSKGRNFHYTQETRVVKVIEDALFDIEKKHPKKMISYDPIKLFFPTTKLKDENLYTYDDEVKEVISEPLFQFTNCPPGLCFKKDFKEAYNVNSFSELLKSYDYSSKEVQDFLPDFNYGPIETYRTSHTLLSLPNGNYREKDIEVTVFKGLYQNREIHWHFAKDRSKKKIWIDKIVFADTNISSYGTFQEVINTGALTNKPLEYGFQADGLVYFYEFNPFKYPYEDITPVLSNLYPIQAFKQYSNDGLHQNCHTQQKMHESQIGGLFHMVSDVLIHVK